ncbi:ATP-binding protein [Baaleninema simplex]|uniref:ATP-binding protein n=1 Tax=Baaleninema simplex TaxID=2862350 RepID=UPI00034D2D83|nr:ATP-binding protein [Baaleninema simplex]
MSSTPNPPHPRSYSDIDLEDSSPIEHYERVGSHGVLVVVDESNSTIVQVSEAISPFFGLSPDAVVGHPLSQLLSAAQLERLYSELPDLTPHTPLVLDFEISHPHDRRTYHTRVHRNNDGLIVLEFEPNGTRRSMNFSRFYQQVRSIVSQLQQSATLEDLCQTTVNAVRHLTAFDRVMAYQFDEDGHGCVIAESKHPDLESYVGLHYPDADTRSCRHLFAANYLRWIPDVRAEEASLVPPTPQGTDKPLDLGRSWLRGVVPCHQVYLENMGSRSTLVMSLTKQQRLWGLVSCHHREPTELSPEIRDACEFVARTTSIELSVKEDRSAYDDRVSSQIKLSQLVEAMSEAKDWVRGATDNASVLLGIVKASGAAVFLNGTCQTVGDTPSQDQIRDLVAQLEPHFQQDLFYSDRLSSWVPQAKDFRNVASGILAVAISQNLGHYLLWFRPETLQTVRWAGNPYDAIEETRDDDGTVRLSPRESFKEWRELVRGKSLPWRSSSLEAALALRDAIFKIVLRQAEELAKLTRELERSNAELEKFAYVASHDLQEPLNLVSSYVQLLEMRYGDRLDDDAKEFIDFAVQGVTHMQRLIEDLLAYSRVGSRGKPFTEVSVETVLKRVQMNLRGRIEETGARLSYDALPVVKADKTQLTQVFQNLLGNALKFRSDRPLEIHASARDEENAWVFSVRDNGIGLDPQFADRIFSIFQRLHTRDEYPGTGIGLAICKRIIERHGGRMWVVSQLGEGATFYFTLPKFKDPIS